jgi:peptidoglycan/LPS O-acetylase OafA/YrhL
MTAPPTQGSTYRADIDGLRAFAVLPVVFFHFKIFADRVTGGFVGVDIFFVISGYLITRIVFSDVSDGTYSILQFYDRRIRRIFPALISLYLACIALAFFLYFPSEALTFKNSVIASTFFVSNIFFYSRSGYFDRDSETNPLLHTWSLSVEEQFYVLFPLVVFAIRAFHHRTRVLVISAIAIASFGAAVYEVYANPSAAFYLVQFRAWELAVGALLAIGALPVISRRWIAEVVAAAGLALVCGSFVFISPTLPFPGLAALAPCLGAAALIYSGETNRTLVGRFLSLSPLQFCGLISYSLYLVHWPAIVFFRLIHEPSRFEKLTLVAACIVLATLSLRFIEKPFRGKSYRLLPRTTLIAGGAAMIGVTVLALSLGPSMNGVFNYPARVLDVMKYAKIDESHLRTGTCFITSGYSDAFESRSAEACLTPRSDRPNYLVIGDSHAAHLWSGLQASYPSVNFLQATASGCRPVFGQGGEEHCIGMVRFIYEKFLPSHKLDGIIISAQWAPKDLPDLIETIGKIRPYLKKVIVIGPSVQYVQTLPRILAKAITLDQPEKTFAARYRHPEEETTDRVFAATLQAAGVDYVSAYKALCDPDCDVWADKDVPIQFDNDHFTNQGSAYLAKKMDLSAILSR